MSWFTTLLAHLLLLLLLAPLPIHFLQPHMQWLRSKPRVWHSNWRVRYYTHYMIEKWIMLILIIIVALGQAWSFQVLGLSFPTQALLVVPYVILCLLIITALTFFARSAIHSETRASPHQSLYNKIPRTPRERLLFIPVCLTAGICEELCFRGFMPAYLSRIFPRIPLLPAIIVAALLFGSLHFPQKFPGVVSNLIMGLIYGLLYYFTGSLLFPIIIHVFFDLRVLLLETTVDDYDNAKNQIPS